MENVAARAAFFPVRAMGREPYGDEEQTAEEDRYEDP